MERKMYNIQDREPLVTITADGEKEIKWAFALADMANSRHTPRTISSAVRLARYVYGTYPKIRAKIF